MSEIRYPFVAVDVNAEDAEVVGALLFELGATGVEERDQQTLLRGEGEGGVTLVASFDSHDEANEAIATLASVPGASHARLQEVVGDAWRDAWKEHFAPFALTSRITVTPPWVSYTKVRDDEIVLELEPGRAFGTGLHATTSLVAKELDLRADALAGKTVLDVGCGSGILAFVALILGAKDAVAIDIDADVVRVVEENAERNGLSDRVTVSAGVVTDVVGAYPVVLANIEARVLGPIAEDLVRTVEPQGLLILSGILAGEHDAMVERYTTLSRPLKHLATRRLSEGNDAWVAIAFSAG